MTLEQTEPAEARHVAWWQVIPSLHGQPVPPDRARELYRWLMGRPLPDWSALAADHPEQADVYQREAQNLDDEARGALLALLVLAAALLRPLPPEILELRAEDGRPVDVWSIAFGGLGRALGDPSRWSGRPPALGGDA